MAFFTPSATRRTCAAVPYSSGSSTRVTFTPMEKRFPRLGTSPASRLVNTL